MIAPARASARPIPGGRVRLDRAACRYGGRGAEAALRGGFRVADPHRLHVVSPKTPGLERIFEMLTRSHEVRTELVDDIRSQMTDGGYMSEEKLNLAIYRMLKDVLA